ncbi:MAG: VCBS repeat-containing protein [Deltaproteobacteria bacterium]|nr:VCBS repeat-containing protein [Deltaproteobacteria bacterium]
MSVHDELGVQRGRGTMRHTSKIFVLPIVLFLGGCPGAMDAPRTPETSTTDGHSLDGRNLDGRIVDSTAVRHDGVATKDGPGKIHDALAYDRSRDVPIVYPDGCVPNCANRECGGDGCGGSCGTCKPYQQCQVKTGVCGPCPVRKRSATASPSTSASWRYGGGYGYPDTVSPIAACTVKVGKTAELEQALKTAQSGMTVYVKDGATLDLTGKSLCIPAGVWLAGGRGRGALPGALLFTSKTTKTPILKACGKGVRVTGLRIWGDDLATCPPSYATKTCSGTYNSAHCRDCEPASYGVVVGGNSGADIEVDNCEMAGWSFAAIALTDGAKNKVHHNYLHHTQRMGLGYGVMLGGTASVVSVLIEGNRFDYYRHAVAGSGSGGEEYEARHNLTGPHTIGHVYDMHGLNEHLYNGTDVAGKRIEIHDNSIFANSQYSFVLRGKPVVGAWFYRNCTARSATTATLQRYFFGNFKKDVTPTGASAPNRYGQSPDQCEAVRWCYSLGAQGPWRYGLKTSQNLASVALGDFNGDGKTDAFRSSGGAWYWSSGASGAWKKLNTSSYPLGSLRMGDFDGDGNTDVFSISGSTWRYSKGGASGWTTLRSASETLTQLAFGDFDGDGRTDAFKTSGGAWYWSSGAQAAWARLNTSGITLGNLAFGDFDGAGKTDVFRASGGTWSVCSGAKGAWKQINASSYGLDKLVFADVNGDGKTDVLSSGPQTWRVSYGGATGWKRWAIESLDARGLLVGDFDGDGRDDLLRAGCY